MALRDVILGYAKGAKGDKGEQGIQGIQGTIGPKGDPGNIADAEITDTYGMAVTAGQKTTAQAIIDAACEAISMLVKEKNTITDDTTKQKYKLGINNGLIYIQEVDE